MILLVSGGREFGLNPREREFIETELAKAFESIPAAERILVHGAARGLDSVVSAWAKRNGVTEKPYPITPADWKYYGNAAGPIRNKQMLEQKPDRVYIFPGGKGTKNMERTAKAEGFETIVLIPPWGDKPERMLFS